MCSSFCYRTVFVTRSHDFSLSDVYTDKCCFCVSTGKCRVPERDPSSQLVRPLPARRSKSRLSLHSSPDRATFHRQHVVCLPIPPPPAQSRLLRQPDLWHFHGSAGASPPRQPLRVRSHRKLGYTSDSMLQYQADTAPQNLSIWMLN